MDQETSGFATPESLRDRAKRLGVELLPLDPPERRRARARTEGETVRVSWFPGFTAAHVIGVAVPAMLAAPLAAVGFWLLPALALAVMAGFAVNSRREVRLSVSPSGLAVSRPRFPVRRETVLPAGEILAVWAARFSDPPAPPLDPLAVEEADWREEARRREARLLILTPRATLRLPSTAGYGEMRWIASIVRSRLAA